MWKVATLLCILIGAMVPLSFIDASLTTGLVGALASICLLAAIAAIRPGELQFMQSVAAGPVAVASLIPLWIFIQMLPLPFLAHPIWKVASENLGEPISGSISIDTGASLQALLLGLASISTGMAVALTAVDPRRARWMARAIIATATALGAISILAGTGIVSSPALGPSWQSGIISTILVCLPVSFAGTLETIRSSGTPDWFERPAHRRAALLLATAIGIGAIYASGGPRLLLPAFVAIGVILLTWLARRLATPDWAMATVWLVLTAIGIGTAAASRPLPAMPLVVAFSNTSGSEASADQLAATLAMVSDVPWAGAGAAASLLPTYLGTPEDVTQPRPVTAAAAVLVSFGPFFFWAMIAIILAGTALLIMSSINRGRDWVFSASAAGALVGLVTTSFLWSIADSEATFILLAAILGMGIAQSVGRSRT